MKRNLFFLVAAFIFLPLSAQYEVRGGSGRPYWAGKNGITEIYLLNGMEGAQIKFTSSQSATHQWYRYKESIDDAVPIPCTQSGNSSVITDIPEGYGYYVAAPVGTGYVWIVDYSAYVSRISGLRVMEDEYKCERLKLIADVEAAPIYYYTGGRQNTLQRKFLLTYNTLKWQEEEKIFIPSTMSLDLEERNLFPEIDVNDPPLTNTTFTLTDSIAEYFGIAQALTSEEYRAIKTEAHYTAEKDREFGDNEKPKTGMESAPIGYTFTAYANEPVAAYYIWKVLKQTDNPGQYTTIVRYTDRVLRYTFENTGNYQVQLEVDDAQSVCADIVDVINVSVDSTRIIIPNAFSPGSSVGVNDELRIQFRSVISFRASIYNRWGNLLYQWTDPTKGWNGMVNGKYVPTGVYFVVVEYTDSEGKKRKEARDVNVLRGKN
ncbi:MAG: gliding motility-associated C-terminal domain-containing protein [Dysgonamonadaceae bacterium]|jgi:gliding motility-associated-like protein|nr:gliding motility-associated C-terminal domain-containing protein [Dysgonamonadaceae bacterium]